MRVEETVWLYTDKLASAMRPDLPVNDVRDRICDAMATLVIQSSLIEALQGTGGVNASKKYTHVRNCRACTVQGRNRPG